MQSMAVMKKVYQLKDEYLVSDFGKYDRSEWRCKGGKLNYFHFITRFLPNSRAYKIRFILMDLEEQQGLIK